MSPRIIVAIFSLLLAPLAHCAMTVGWKMPVDSVVGDLSGNEGAHKLTKPPGSSAFFQPGDELWDISEAVMQRGNDEDEESDPPSQDAGKEKWPGEWLLWNARSGMIIARGSRANILSAQTAIGVQDQPRLVRSKFDLVSGSAGKTGSVSLLGRSGEKTMIEFSPWRIEASSTLGSSDDAIDEQLKVGWSDGAVEWELSTAVICHLGERIRLASQGSGKQRWELFLTTQCEYPGGVPLSDVRWQESPQGLVPWPIPPEGDRPFGKTPEGLDIGVYDVSPNLLDSIQGEEKKVVLPEIPAPAALAEVVRGNVVDLREISRSKGLAMGPGSFGAFDQRRSRVIFAGSAADREMVDSLFSGGEGGCWNPGEWVETDPASGGWGIHCRSGERALLSGKSGEKELGFEVEVTLGIPTTDVEVRYSIDLVEKLESKGRVTSAINLHSGTPQVIASRTLPGQDDQKVTLTARPNLPMPEKQAAKPAPKH